MRLRQEDACELLEKGCSEKELSMDALRTGSRNREYSMIRQELARKFVMELGLSLADAARMLGISRAGVSMLVRR